MEAGIEYGRLRFDISDVKHQTGELLNFVFC